MLSNPLLEHMMSGCENILITSVHICLQTEQAVSYYSAFLCMRICFWVHISMYGDMFSRAQIFDHEFLKCYVFTFMHTKNCLSQTNTLIHTHVCISLTNSGPFSLVTSVFSISY